MASHFERLQIVSEVFDYHIRGEETAVFPVTSANSFSARYRPEEISSPTDKGVT